MSCNIRVFLTFWSLSPKREIRNNNCVIEFNKKRRMSALIFQIGMTVLLWKSTCQVMLFKLEHCPSALVGNTQHYPASKPFEYIFWWVETDDEPTNQLQTYVSRNAGLRRREDRTVKISVKSAAGEKHFKIKEHVAKEKDKNCISDKMIFLKKQKNFLLLLLPPHRFHTEKKIEIYLKHRRNCKWGITEFLC